MFLCSIIKIVCNEAVTANKVDDAALEKLNMKPGAGGEDLNCVRGDMQGDRDSPDRSRGYACAWLTHCEAYRLARTHYLRKGTDARTDKIASSRAPVRAKNF